MVCAPAARAQLLAFTAQDWLAHRGTPTRQGLNGDPGLPVGQQLQFVWKYPETQDMPAEIVVDNTILPVPAPAFPPSTPGYPAPTQDFSIQGAGWVYPSIDQRTGGAWPPNDPDFNKLDDYIYTLAAQSTVLSDIGVGTLQHLPNLSDVDDPDTAVNQYNKINAELTKAGVQFARWSFGTTYPYGTIQGTRQISYIKTPVAPAVPVDPTDFHQTPITPRQRYAVYIRFPSSGTFDPTFNNGAGTNRPNVNHAMVRVSWGANPDDPVTSRIFMIDMGQTGGSWVRLRNSAIDDRYFPYDGTNPIRVTLYNVTPDDPNNTDDFGVPPIVVADAVRLVPEALRGDIHGSAVSATVPIGGATRNTQLTYFGRDETTGPIWPDTLAKTFDAGTGKLLYPPTGLPAIPFDPTKPANNDPTSAAYNPLLDDPTVSIRSANFYCIEDQLLGTVSGVVNSPSASGALRWRFPATTRPINTVTADNDVAGEFATAGGGFAAAPAGGGPFNVSALVASVSGVASTATWTKALPATSPNQKWSVFVWIPAGTTEDYAHFARYHIRVSDGSATPGGFVDIETMLNQNMTVNRRIGGWRQIAGGVQFPGTFNAGLAYQQSYSATGQVTLLSDSPLDVADAGPARMVVADAVQFVAESQTPARVVASPLLANVDWGNTEPPPLAAQRQVVYFATTDGHIWALDAYGTSQPGLPYTTTSAYWVYPSISNPDPLFPSPQGGYAAGVIRGLQDDPNYNPDAANNRANRGIDADLTVTSVGGQPVFTAVRQARPLAEWLSSPVMVRVLVSVAPLQYQKYLVIANANGRLYSFDPVGRMNGGAPFAASLAATDSFGIPGTTRRLMTWPSTARDKWLRKSNTDSEFANYSDDPAKQTMQASPAVDVAQGDIEFIATRAILGAGDGHVYAVDLSFPGLNPQERISHSTVNNLVTDGQPLWLYPNDKTQLDAITQTGALSTDFARYVFGVGGRVYSIATTAAPLAGGAPGTPAVRWIYPFTATPPRNPAATDVVPLDTDFTAPVIAIPPAGFNGGNESVFIANRDGTIRAFDNTVTGNVANQPLWTSLSGGTTRASVTYLANLNTQLNIFSSRNANGPALFLPLDNGALTAVDVLPAAGVVGGKFVWSFVDALLGAVPLNGLDVNNQPTLTFFATSNAYRGADAVTANQFVFQGDEGNQDTGEVNGQMHAYGSQLIGTVSSGEPNISPVNGGVELRLVELWDSRRDQVAANLQVWDDFGLPNMAAAKSPYTEYLAGNRKPDTRPNFAIYEWGDTIYVAAWGIFSGNALPQVFFNITGDTQPIPAIVTPDLAYAGPNLFTTDPVLGMTPGRPFVAKAQYTLSRGSDAFPQTPGSMYRITAYAQLSTPGATARTATYYAGQFDDPAINPGPPKDPNNTLPPPAGIGPPRNIGIAHPFALTTRGPSAPGQPNVVGWTDNIPADNSTTDLTEVMANGNAITSFVNNLFVPTTLKDLVAPVGFVTHGSSSGYVTYDNAGNAAPGLFIADRSNLWKNNQRLSGVRVERTDMHWGWDTTGAAYTDATFGPLQKATGNVMNPLPWESFPNTVPNVSPDYPDIKNDHASFKLANQDMSARGITLIPPTVAGNIKTLHGTQIDLTVDAPKFQPANVNAHYYNINGNQNNLLVSPMNRSTGNPGGTPVPVAASAGYVGSYAIYVDRNNDGVFQGFAPGVSRGQRVVLLAAEEVYRQLNVGIGVPPDVNLRTEEETVDIGTVPHSEGYDPNFLFQPSFFGRYSEWGGVAPAPFSVWDKGFGLFRPFTVRNQGNVNLVDVRAAKIAGDYTASANPANPLYWMFFQSDQVQQPPYTYNNPLLAAVGFYPFPNGAGNIGVVSSLDHRNDANTNTWENDLWTWSNALLGYRIPNGGPVDPAFDYVVNGNVLGWQQYTRRHPTVVKPRPGDSNPITMSIPDVAYGDPGGLLTALTNHDTKTYGPGNERTFKPQISVAIPLGTPAGTYSMPVYVFEDHIPEQWRSWVYYQQNVGGIGNPDQIVQNAPGDNDGVMNTVPQGGVADPRLIAEARANPFQLKVTVAEARLTNGSSPASYIQIDNRGNNPALGANIQPVATRDQKTGNLVLYWPSNRFWNGTTWVDPGTPDAPWYLFSTQLNMAGNNALPLSNQTFYDWQYEPGGKTQWWNPLGLPQQYPTATVPIEKGLFPAQTSEILPGAPGATPLVPGNLNPLTVRHATPALVQDEDTSNNGLGTLLFWQGSATKTGAAGGTFANDTRTFYVPLTQGKVPDPAAQPPYSFLNDPNLPKYAPKPLIVVDRNNNKLAFLFWFGGEQGRSRLYYNSNPRPGVAGMDLTDVTRWSQDTLLQTPGALQYQSDPTPVHRRVFTTWFNPQGEFLDCIDVVYTGVLTHRRQPETLLTRYAIDYPRDTNGVITNTTPTGRLVPIPIGVQDATIPNGATPTPQTAWNPGVVSELLARQGNSATWVSRDVAWLYSANRWDAANGRFRRDLLDATGNPYFKLTLVDRAGNATNVLQTNFANPPEFDTATGRVYINSALGGRVIIDPQGGTVTFNGVSPTNTDRLLLSYTPQSLRLNVSRNDVGVIAAPGGADNQSGVAWASDPAFAPRTHVEPSGPETGPVAFIDRFQNPRYRPGQVDNTVFGVAANTVPPVSRMWLLFRKTDASTASPSTVWYKTMRLMIRLPRGVIREANGDITPHIAITGNQGPFEVDWIRGRIYFTEVDEGSIITVTKQDYARQNDGTPITVPPTQYRVEWGDEISSAVTPGDATTNERILPLSTPVNEGQISAFKDPFQDKVWVFWSSTRAGTTDLYYMAINPQLYTQPGF